MIIDREKLDDRLGDDNFEYIMEALHVTDYDPVRKRCCCPFHQEKTPSFIYNSKAKNCICFGCRTTVDAFSAEMIGNKLTFVEAAQKVFERAGVTYSFGEHGVKTRHQYRYPHPEQNEHKEKVYNTSSLARFLRRPLITWTFVKTTMAIAFLITTIRMTRFAWSSIGLAGKSRKARTRIGVRRAPTPRHYSLT